MKMKVFARDLAAAKRDRTGKFREVYTPANGRGILCESKSEYDHWSNLDRALTEGKIKPEEFSLRESFESLVEGGRDIADEWRRNRGDGGGPNLALLEASGQVDSSAFANITGQIVYNKIKQAYEAEEFVFSKLIQDVNTQFNGEKIPGVSNLGDVVEEVAESQPYPTAGISEDWFETPETKKRGVIVPITKEAIFFDLTGLVLRNCAKVGEAAGINKEKRAIDAVIDENTTAHRHNWKGTKYATYQASTPWVNVTASNALVDWTDLDAAEQTMANLVDPQTGEPIVVTPTQLIVCRGLRPAAEYILGALERMITTPGYATSGVPTQVRTSNPYQGRYQLVSSSLLASRLATDTNWFLGNIGKAVVHMQNWPLTVTQAPPNSSDEFHRDIVAQYKCSQRGAFFVEDPRQLHKSTA